MLNPLIKKLTCATLERDNESKKLELKAFFSQEKIVKRKNNYLDNVNVMELKVAARNLDLSLTLLKKEEKQVFNKKSERKGLRELRSLISEVRYDKGNIRGLGGTISP